MKITVLAFGLLREQAGLSPGKASTLELPEGALIADALVVLGLDPDAVVHLLLDGRNAVVTDLLQDGAELTLMPAFAGGV
ncbi:MAG: MoaD/ThiS family protein [Actinomycetota bacterium]